MEGGPRLVSRPTGALPPPVLAGLPTKQRVLTSIRWLYRRDGMSPSHSQIADVARIATKRVRSYVERLAADGFLTFEKGVPFSIRLADRGAELSDEEIERIVHGRNGTITWTKLPGLGDVYPVEPLQEGVADWGLNLLAKLDDISGTLPPSRSRPGSVEDGEAAQEEDEGDRRDRA